MGEDGSGKTSLVHSFTYGNFPEPSDPVYENIYSKNVIYEPQGDVTEITILDTSSTNDWLPLRNGQLENAEAILLTFAINDRDSYEAVVELHERLLGLDIPIAVVGLKSDLHANRQVPMVEAAQFATTIGATHFCECSSLMGTVNDAFEPLVQYFIEQKKQNLSPEAPESEVPSPPEPNIDSEQQSRYLHDITEVETQSEPERIHSHKSTVKEILVPLVAIQSEPQERDLDTRNITEIGQQH